MRTAAAAAGLASAACRVCRTSSSAVSPTCCPELLPARRCRVGDLGQQGAAPCRELAEAVPVPVLLRPAEVLAELEHALQVVGRLPDEEVDQPRRDRRLRQRGDARGEIAVPVRPRRLGARVPAAVNVPSGSRDQLGGGRGQRLVARRRLRRTIGCSYDPARSCFFAARCASTDT